MSEPISIYIANSDAVPGRLRALARVAQCPRCGAIYEANELCRNPRCHLGPERPLESMVEYRRAASRGLARFPSISTEMACEDVPQGPCVACGGSGRYERTDGAGSGPCLRCNPTGEKTMPVAAIRMSASELSLLIDGAPFAHVRGVRTWIEHVNGEPVRAIEFDYYVPVDRAFDADFETCVARRTKHELRLVTSYYPGRVGAGTTSAGVFESAEMGYDDNQRTEHARTGDAPMVQRVRFRGSWAPFEMQKIEDARAVAECFRESMRSR